MTAVAAAYSAGAEAWSSGPMQVYGRLAELLVDRSPVELAGRLVLDLGTGTGAAAHAAAARGARVIAVDLAVGMLSRDRAHRPPATAGDALALPFAAGSFDAVVAAFALNHLADPSAGAREVGRVTRAGGFVLASTYAADDDHSVKAAADAALVEAGWVCPSWYLETKKSMAAWGTLGGATDIVERGGLVPVGVDHVDVAYPDLDPEALVWWRFGLAHCAPFVAALDQSRRDALVRRAVELLPDDAGQLVRSVIFVTARVR